MPWFFTHIFPLLHWIDIVCQVTLSPHIYGKNICLFVLMLGMNLWFALATDTSDNAPVLTLGLNRHYIFLLLLLNLCHLVGGRGMCSAGLLVLVGVERRKTRDVEVKLAHCWSLRRAVPQTSRLMSKVNSHGCMLLRVWGYLLCHKSELMQGTIEMNKVSKHLWMKYNFHKSWIYIVHCFISAAWRTTWCIVDPQ